MNITPLMKAVAFCAMGLTTSAWAADAATVDEVIAKVKAAAVAVEANGDAALPEFDKKDGKWAWKDSYVFVMDCKAGIMKAHPDNGARGTALSELKDKGTFKEIGTPLCSAAEKTNGGWVEYAWPKPGVIGAYRKISYVLPAGRYVVGAGIYNSDNSVQELDAKVGSR